MATLNRRPLVNRSIQPSLSFSPLKSRSMSGTKRPRSPDPQPDTTTSHPTAKRVKAVPLAPIRELGRERKHLEREQQKAEFRDKYTRAFPGWTFCFDEDNIGIGPSESFKARIRQLGGKIDDFYSSSISHYITNRQIPNVNALVDKENNPKASTSNALKSPIKLRGRSKEDIDVSSTFDVLRVAITTGQQKIWNSTKLDSVLTRLLDLPSAPTLTSSKPNPGSRLSVANPQRTLSRLLQSERVHGTMERDPTQKRHDFRYFTRGSRFVLVEDLRQELATITWHEYLVPKGTSTKDPWPVLHCHPHTRGPFIAYDEKERKRWEKVQMTEANTSLKRKDKIRQVETMKRKAEANLHAKRTSDLRRSVSMNNLHRRSHLPARHDQENLIDLEGDGEIPDSANASGFLASGNGAGYMAASGNSVGITSTTGTTSNAGYTSRNFQLPSALSGRIKQQIVTSRKPPTAAAGKIQGEQKSVMGPPSAIPERKPLLKKSKSTNTLRLPKREEGSKPGYCESCRSKFDDFKVHIIEPKHMKFASNAANFLQLDCVLARVQRRTQEEVREEKVRAEGGRKFYCGILEGDVEHCPDVYELQSPEDENMPQDTEMRDDSIWS